jgi:hypothetical protein
VKFADCAGAGISHVQYAAVWRFGQTNHQSPEALGIRLVRFATQSLSEAPKQPFFDRGEFFLLGRIVARVRGPCCTIRTVAFVARGLDRVEGQLVLVRLKESKGALGLFKEILRLGQLVIRLIDQGILLRLGQAPMADDFAQGQLERSGQTHCATLGRPIEQRIELPLEAIEVLKGSFTGIACGKARGFRRRCDPGRPRNRVSPREQGGGRHCFDDLTMGVEMALMTINGIREQNSRDGRSILDPGIDIPKRLKQITVVLQRTGERTRSQGWDFITAHRRDIVREAQP